MMSSPSFSTSRKDAVANSFEEEKGEEIKTTTCNIIPQYEEDDSYFAEYEETITNATAKPNGSVQRRGGAVQSQLLKFAFDASMSLYDIIDEEDDSDDPSTLVYPYIPAAESIHLSQDKKDHSTSCASFRRFKKMKSCTASIGSVSQSKEAPNQQFQHDVLPTEADDGDEKKGLDPCQVCCL